MPASMNRARKGFHSLFFPFVFSIFFLLLFAASHSLLVCIKTILPLPRNSLSFHQCTMVVSKF